MDVGRVGICLETSMMSYHLVLPREGHLYQVYHMFTKLKKYHNLEMIFDPSAPVIDEEKLDRKEWNSSEFWHAQEEELPTIMTDPHGFGFTIITKVDDDHGADTITHRYITGFIVYLNTAPIYWNYKKQNSVKLICFGLEFIAMNNFVNTLEDFDTNF